MLSAMVMTAVLSVAPDAGRTAQHIYEFQLKGVRVGVVVLELNGKTYRYGSVHVVNREGEVSRRLQGDVIDVSPKLLEQLESRRRRGDVLELSDESQTWRGHVPATLALVTLSSQRGCVPVVDEVTRKLGEYCVKSRDGCKAAGTLFGKAVTVVLAGDIAAEIEFPSDLSRFIRVDKASEPTFPPDLSADGLLIPGAGELRVQPPVETTLPQLKVVKHADATRWFEAVRDADHLFCVDYAEAFVRRAGGGSAAIVHGLRIDGDRAFPHAWVRVVTERGPVEYDPTFGVKAESPAYVPLMYAADARDQQKVGAMWLSFLNGRRKVSREQPR